MTPEQSHALDTARGLAAAGVPVFVAWPDAAEPTGYKLPIGWQRTPADPAVVDTWQPGMALGLVMGQGVDLLDVDPRSGGDLTMLDGQTPTSYGAALTPSGGVHSFIRSMGVRSKDGVLPGIDVKGGDADGKGRGFAFIAPTVRVSKTTGQPTAYRWVTPPDLTRLQAALADPNGDLSGAGLAALINAARAKAGADDSSIDGFLKTGPWKNIPGTLSAGRNNGVAKLAAALRGRGGWRLDDAIEFMYARVWPEIDQGQSGHEFDAGEFESTIAAAWRQYPDGQQQRAQERAELAAVPPTPDGPPPSPARYFVPTEGGLQAATLAGDVMALGPLARGVDDIMWSYDAGVWRPDRHVIRDRIARVLGQRHRRGHNGTVEDIVLAYVDTITCDPVSDLINFRNGLLNWETGELGPHAPEVPSTVQLGVDHNPNADCPRFEQFLGQVVPPDMVETVWELIGYLMYSGNPLHAAVMLTGTGRNGKGTFLRVLMAVLGRRNVTSISLHDLMNTRFSTASLFGKLANIAGDIDGGYLENTATFKAITGGDTISAEHKGRDRFDFTPWAVPVFSANKIPASADTTSGYLDRWLILPFPNSFTGREDRSLDRQLNTPSELEGIAARGIAALPGLLHRGNFAQTTSGRAAKDEFVRRVDQVQTWIFDCAEIHPDLPWTNRTELYEAYKRWAARDGHKPVRASEFYDRLESAGAEPAIIHGSRGFKRIRVVDNGWITTPGAPGAATFMSGNGVQGTAAAAAPGPETAPDDVPETPADPGVQDAAAPSSELPLTWENTETEGTQGALGADRPHPPSAYVHARGDRDLAAPPAPDLTKAELKAAARAEAIRAAVEAASGPSVPLPALVTRDGAVRSIRTADADALLDTVTRPGHALTVDVETSGYPVGHEDYELRTAQLGIDAFAVDLDPTDPEQADVARRHLKAARALHAHSATADLVPLAHEGLVDTDDAWAKMFDTVIPAKLADPASTGSDPGLKKLAEAVLGDEATSTPADAARAELFKAGKWLTDVEVTTPVERSGWAQVSRTSTTMIRYAASDVLDTAALAKRLPDLPPHILERERLAQRMTARIAHVGLPLDAPRVKRLLVEHTEAREAHAGKVKAFGIDNPGSGQQVAAKLTEMGVHLPRTKPSKTHPTGQPSVAEGILDPLRGADGPVGELVNEVLQFRHHKTVTSLFMGPFDAMVTRGDGRIRSTIYTLGADTGRMSSVRFNLQQISRVGGIRACINADLGHLLVSADFSGVELRVGAALSQDQNLIQMLDEGIDLHGEIARQVFGPDATKANRYTVKPGVFAWLYGGSVPTIASQLMVSHQVAQAIVDTLANIAPGLAEWCRMTAEGVKAGRSQFETYSGRIVHMPVRSPHAGPNYCIQGTARELLIDGLVKWDRTRWGKSVMFPVHDEVVAMVPEAEAAEATQALVDCMTNEIYGVKILVEPSKPAFAWQDAS